MKKGLHLPSKIILAVSLVGLMSYLYFSNPKDSKPKESQKPSVVTPGGPVSIFDPGEATELTWVFRDKTRRFAKNPEGHWASLQAREYDPWGVQRRVTLLSRLPLKKNFSLTAPIGRVVIKTPQASFEGIFTQSQFMWDSGPAVGSGIDFGDDIDIRRVFEEGTMGFEPHGISICEPDKLSEIYLANHEATLRKSDKKWLLFLKDKEPLPLRDQVTQPWLKALCNVTADYFKEEKTEETGAPVVRLKDENGRQFVLTVRNGVYTGAQPAPFMSDSFSQTLKLNVETLIDPTLDEAKVALDSQKSQSARVAAIRKIKELGSPQAIPALKILLFENTDLDVYRYEATDALAAIGTSEALQAIADRLSQVGRSGFQLRLGRALAAHLGYPFTSDEHTPDEVRQTEVQDLLAEFKKERAPTKSR